MKTLITPKQAAALAFTDGEFVAEQSIAEADIAAAEERYIRPVVGRALYARLLEGAYAEFTADYLAAPTALFTRLMIQPGLDIRTGQCGTAAPRSDAFQPAGDAQLRRLQKALRTKARTLLRRAATHLGENAMLFPEYDDGQNALNRCTIESGFVLMR